MWNFEKKIGAVMLAVGAMALVVPAATSTGQHYEQLILSSETEVFEVGAAYLNFVTAGSLELVECPFRVLAKDGKWIKVRNVEAYPRPCRHKYLVGSAVTKTLFEGELEGEQGVWLNSDHLVNAIRMPEK